MTRKKIIIPVRARMPVSCIECHGVIHRKSEHYCSKQCENVYEAPTDEKRPSFRSKWKERKLKEAKDPLIRERKKVRRKTNDLLKAIVEDKRFIVNNSKDSIFAELKVARKTTNREP